MKIIESRGHEHAATINSLAERGIIRPVKFEFRGVTYVANSAWAATDWLREQGYYASQQNEVVVLTDA